LFLRCFFWAGGHRIFTAAEVCPRGGGGGFGGGPVRGAPQVGVGGKGGDLAFPGPSAGNLV